MYEKRYSDMADSERVKLESDVEDSYDIYPHPTVRVVRPHNRGIGTSWKEALTELTQRKAFLGGLAVLVFTLLLSIVIILMVQNHHDEKAKQQEQHTSSQNTDAYGLFSYPYVEAGDVIKFRSDDYLTYRDWMGQLENALAPYSPHLLSSSNYTQCDLRSRKPGEQCLVHIYELGDPCSHGKDFGYSKSRPCILLQLQLPFSPGSVVENSDTWQRLHKEMGDRWNPLFIGVKCEGVTELDNKYLNRSGKGLFYTPSSGFNSRFFPSNLDDDLYLAPLVMVQIPELPLHQPVAVRCTAWPQNENGTLPNIQPLYTTKFTIQTD